MQGIETIAILPAKNEEKNISFVALNAKRFCNQLVLVDSSSDRTVEEFLKAVPEGIVLKSAPGKGMQLRKGIAFALKKKPRFIVLLDSDAEILPQSIEVLKNALIEKKADFALGQRIAKRSTKRAFLNSFASFWINFLTGYNLRDCLSGCIVGKADSFKELFLKSKNYEFEIELLLEAKKTGLKVVGEEIKQGKTAKSGVSFAGMIELNNFFDSWFLENHSFIEMPALKKVFLFSFSLTGLLIGSILKKVF